MSYPMAIFGLLSLAAGLWAVFALVSTALGWFLAGALAATVYCGFDQEKRLKEARRKLDLIAEDIRRRAHDNGWNEGWKEGLDTGLRKGREQGALEEVLAARKRTSGERAMVETWALAQPQPERD